MIKWIVALKFRSGDREAHRHAWLDEHGNQALQVAGVKHYCQSHRAEDVEDSGNAPFDGFESFWFENSAAAKKALASSAVADLTARATGFLDPKATKQFLAQEIILRDVPEADHVLKLVTFNYRKVGMSPRLFQDYWLNKHGPLVLRNFAALGRYVQNHALIESYTSEAEPDFDGMLEAWLTSLDALQAGAGTPETQAVRADEGNFLDPIRFRFLLVRERRFR